MQCVTLSIKEICFIMGLDSMLWVPIILNSYCCGNCEATVMMIGDFMEHVNQLFDMEFFVLTFTCTIVGAAPADRTLLVLGEVYLNVLS